MNVGIERRAFLRLTSAGVLSVTTSGLRATSSSGASVANPTTGLGLKKAVKFGMVREDLLLVDKFKLLKEMGFDGVEMKSPSGLDREEVVDAVREAGLPIHGVVDSVHWRKTLSDADPIVRQEGLEALETAVRDASAYGADTVLLVPAVVSEVVSYDDAYGRSQVEIRKVLPLARELGVKVGFENVGNNFLLSPLEFARYIDEFESPWVGAYFDIGNVLRYGWPDQWIRILGSRILKLDIKERNRGSFARGTPRPKIGEGDIDWPAVRRAIREIGYQGWATAEVEGGGRDRLRDIAQRMDRVL